MTKTEAASFAGGLVGGMLVAVIIFAIAFYVLMVIAQWKIFTKAGEKGWKALIPIYNVYVLCKIIGINFWIWVLAIPVGLGIVSGLIFGNDQNSINAVSTIYGLVIEIYTSIKLAKAFKKGTGFTVGLILLPNIFQLILAFGSAEYAGIEKN